MPKFKRGEVTPNQDYLKSWDEYQAEAIKTKRHRSHPLLLPISIDIADGVIVRERIKANLVKEIYAKHKSEFPKGMFKEKNRWAVPDPDKIFSNYIEAFPDDFAQSALPPSPLDISIRHPTWLLAYLPRDNWTFCEACQYSVENDRDDIRRNFEKICMFGDRKYLILFNRHRSNPKKLKFNFHVNIHQVQDGKDMWTDIIIDPGTNNDGYGSGSGGGGGDY